MSQSPHQNGMTDSVMTPREIVNELDQFIIGQSEAKRAVAIALRNRWRRMQLPQELRAEVTPKNILMIGPTGVGKTKIAKQISKIAKAPFLKVEATKFTEIGYVGRDVESIIRDLADTAVKMFREEALSQVKERANAAAEQRILDELLPKPPHLDSQISEVHDQTATREKLLTRLREGKLDDQEIDVAFTTPGYGVEIMAPPGMEEITSQLSSIMQNLAKDRKKARKLRIKEALKLVREEESSKLIDDDMIKTKALEAVEQNGIVFIDEIDKIARKSGQHISSADISREGVQRDLLPLIEGCTVVTKYGMVRTDHILFIASGAFHIAKPSDLVPELQGRLPIRVELKALTASDFERILTEPKASLTEQYIELLKTEHVHVHFTKDGISRIAEIAWQINEQNENIGARRLHTVMERLLETISFEATDKPNTKIVINKKYVNAQLNELLKNQDLSRYIL